MSKFVYEDGDLQREGTMFTDDDLKFARKVLENLVHYPKLSGPRGEPRELRHDLRVVAEALAQARASAK